MDLDTYPLNNVAIPSSKQTARDLAAVHNEVLRLIVHFDYEYATCSQTLTRS